MRDSDGVQVNVNDHRVGSFALKLRNEIGSIINDVVKLNFGTEVTRFVCKMLGKPPFTVEGGVIGLQWVHTWDTNQFRNTVDE